MGLIPNSQTCKSFQLKKDVNHEFPCPDKCKLKSREKKITAKKM